MKRRRRRKRGRGEEEGSKAPHSVLERWSLSLHHQFLYLRAHEVLLLEGKVQRYQFVHEHSKRVDVHLRKQTTPTNYESHRKIHVLHTLL